MKYFYLLLILLFLSVTFISCNSYKSELNAYNDIVDIELAKDTVITEIFMNLKYGDSKSITNKKLRKLLKQKKIYKNKEGLLEYEFTLEEGVTKLTGKVKAIIDVKFFNDKLYELTLRASLDRTNKYYISDESRLRLIHLGIHNIFHSKYLFKGYKTLEIKNSLSDENMDRYLINSNNQIMISTFLYTDVTYTDLRILKEMELQEKKENQKKNKANEKEYLKKINDI